MNTAAIKDYFDARADTWNIQHESTSNKHLMVAQLAGVTEGARVLDVGCGTGIMEPAYLELGAQEILALDVSEKMIDNAKGHFDKIPESRLRFECADVIDYARTNADSVKGHFDVVVIYNAYPHIHDKPELVIAVHNLLKVGGRFLVAHGMGRAKLNAHHSEVPANVTSELHSSKEESAAWSSLFDIDMVADAPYIYFFGGQKR